MSATSDAEKLAKLVSSGRYLDALRLIASDKLLSAVVRQAAPRMPYELAVLAALRGARPDELMKLLNEIGVRYDHGLIEAAYLIHEGRFAEAARFLTGAAKAAAELAGCLVDPSTAMRLVKELASSDPVIAKYAAVLYVSKYLERRGYDPRLLDVLKAAGLKQPAEVLERVGPIAAAAFAEALARRLKEWLEKGAIIIEGGKLAELVKLEKEIREVAQSLTQVASLADKTSDPAQLADLALDAWRLAERLERLVDEARRLGARVELRVDPRRVAESIAVAAVVDALVEGRSDAPMIYDKVRGIIAAVDPELARLLGELVHTKLSMSDVYAILSCLLPGFKPAPYGAPPGHRGPWQAR